MRIISHTKQFVDDPPRIVKQGSRARADASRPTQSVIACTLPSFSFGDTIVELHVVETIFTPRLELVPITLRIVEAVMTADRSFVEEVVQAKVPAAWPGRALVERAFSASLDRIRENPDVRLWGDRLMVARDGPRRIVGSVIFHGRPGEDGIAEVGYGVEEASQGLGLATEGTRACVDWALKEKGVRLVRATTPPWHRSSIRVLEKSGFRCVGSEDHPALGEVSVFERDA